MSDLSPQAQEVFWAFNRAASGKPDDWHYLPAIAAALRAAADQVAPETPHSEADDPKVLKGIWDERRTIRVELLSIADELEAQ